MSGSAEAAALERLLAGARGPAGANIAEVVCDRHARRDPDSPAVIALTAAGRRVITFGQLETLSRRFASVLAARDLRAGDRVAVCLGQGIEMPIAVLACWRLGLTPLPIPQVFSGEGLAHRLQHSGARALITDDAGLDRLEALPDAAAGLDVVWTVETPSRGARGFWIDLEAAAPVSGGCAPGGQAPAFMMYTSGTTGKAKGVVHTHDGFAGGMPGVALIHGGLRDGDLAWSPAEWSWIAGFSGLVFAFLYFGRPVVAWAPPHPFDAEQVVRFLTEEGVRNSLLTPTMLRLIQQSGAGRGLRLRSLLATGEALGEDLFAYCQDELGVTACEAYGQTECAPITVNNPTFMPRRLGALGRAAPGLQIEIVDVLGQPVPDGEVGEIAVRRDHPSVFSGYWTDAAATHEKLRGDWMMTGDEARRDADGFLWFLGRNDDIIKSSGYRIGPSEIEACLARHPAVELVAVVGLPHATRGAEVTAAVQLKRGIAPDPALADDLLAFGAARLERHERPRRVVFVETLPLTVTGKLMRKALKQDLINRPAPEIDAHV